MQDAKTLRTRGERMRELASRAYCERHYGFARLLMQLAMEVFARARDVEEPYAASIRVETSGRRLRHRR